MKSDREEPRPGAEPEQNPSRTPSRTAELHRFVSLPAALAVSGAALQVQDPAVGPQQERVSPRILPFGLGLKLCAVRSLPSAAASRAEPSRAEPSRATEKRKAEESRSEEQLQEERLTPLPAQSSLLLPVRTGGRSF